MDIKIKQEDPVADTTVSDSLHLYPDNEDANETVTLESAQDIKCEPADEECATGDDSEDVKIKLEALIHEELDIKSEEYPDESETTSLIIDCTFICGICNKELSTKSKLKRHLKIHSSDKPFQCNVCDYKCFSRSDLRQHILTHTGEKPYQCNACAYKCSRKSTLSRHMITHKGEKLLRCIVCDYICSRKGQLRLHIKTHTGEKPLQRSVCD